MSKSATMSSDAVHSHSLVTYLRMLNTIPHKYINMTTPEDLRKALQEAASGSWDVIRVLEAYTVVLGIASLLPVLNAACNGQEKLTAMQTILSTACATGCAFFLWVTLQAHLQYRETLGELAVKHTRNRPPSPMP